MRLITSVIAGFIAVGAATPAGLAVKPTSTRGSVDAVPARPTPADGNWHIGCDANNYCSYYQDSDIAAGSAESSCLRTITLSESTCKQCTSQDPCSWCDIGPHFSCRDCDHYQCVDEYLNDHDCFDIQPELADAIRNSTITATIFETATSTTVETSSTIATVSSVEVTTITITPTSVSEFLTTIVMPTPTSEPTITITRTAVTNMITHTVFPPRHSGLAPRNEAVSNDADTQPPARRNAAFKQTQCVPCDASTCPECHNDCASCEKFRCEDPTAQLTVCMSVRSKWLPPSFNISASAPSETTTVVVMPQPGTTTTTQTVVYSTVISTISTPSVSTVTVLPTPSPPVATVTVSAPAVSTTTVVVAPQASTVITTTIVSVPQVPLSTVTIYPQAPQISTVIVAPPRPQVSTVTVISQRPQTSTVVVAPPQLQTNTVTIQKSTVTVQNPASTVVYQQPGTTSTVTYHYQDPASTVVLQPPTVTASRSPSVIEIPMTMISTATHTVARSARAVPTSAPALVKSSCESCDGNPECDGCEFSCDGGCEHFLCKDRLNGEDICMSFAEDAQASRAYNASMASGNFLGSAAMLLVLDDGEDLASNVSTIRPQPEVSNSTRPNFVFNEEDCHLCESGDESCDMCDWQFNCGMKKKCFHNGAREIVEICFEKGEKCRP